MSLFNTVGNVNDNPGLLVEASQVVDVIAAEMTDRGVHQGAEIAALGTRYNYSRHDQVDDYIEDLEGSEARGDCTEIQEKCRAISIEQQDELIVLCTTDSAVCAAEYQHLVEGSELFHEVRDCFGGRDLPWLIGLDAGPLLCQYMEAESFVSQEGFAQFLQEQHGLDHEQASILSAMAAGAVGGIGSMARPTARQSALDVGTDLGPSARPQVTYKNRPEVPYATRGSVRPDWCTADVCSFDVKNDIVATISSGFVRNVSRQVVQRPEHFPTGMQQQVVIDIRGQNVSDAQINTIIRRIVDISGGVISPTEIGFKTE